MKIILLFCLLVSGCYTTSAQNICGGPGSLPPEFDIADIDKYQYNANDTIILRHHQTGQKDLYNETDKPSAELFRKGPEKTF